MARPKSIECEVCGETVVVSARGPVPRFCADHTAADLAPTPEPEPEPAPEPEPVNDGWPKRIAPEVYLSPDGGRHNDSGEAQRATERWRAAQS